jgi:hypothetical protein
MATQVNIDKSLSGLGKIGRGERIRTSGLYVPNVALYQAKLHPDAHLAINQSLARLFFAELRILAQLP